MNNDQIYYAFSCLGIPDGWPIEGQRFNFDLLTHNLDLHNSSVLDIGCGSGALFHYLSKYKGVSYTGLDIRRNAFQDIQSIPYIPCDFMDWSCDYIYDWSFASGTLSTVQDPIPFLLKMSHQSTYGFAFNFLDALSEHQDSNFVYHELDELLSPFSENAKCVIDTPMTINGKNFRQTTVQIFQTLDIPFSYR